MYTIGYKGYYIHGYCDHNDTRISCNEGTINGVNFKSLHAAKIYISTKLMKRI
jgi:hypothetical protein